MPGRLLSFVDGHRAAHDGPIVVHFSAHRADEFGGVTFDSSVQSQRGALALVNGILYLPYGGFYDDCGNYHGWG